MAKSLMNMGGQKQPQQPPLEIYKGQDPFASMQQALPIQDQDPLKLAMALRNENGY